jgi:hypothetical protein
LIMNKDGTRQIHPSSICRFTSESGLLVQLRLRVHQRRDLLAQAPRLPVRLKQQADSSQEQLATLAQWSPERGLREDSPSHRRLPAHVYFR